MQQYNLFMDIERFANLKFIFGKIEDQLIDPVEFEFPVSVVRLLIGDDGKVLEIKLVEVEQEVVDEMCLKMGK